MCKQINKTLTEAERRLSEVIDESIKNGLIQKVEAFPSDWDDQEDDFYDDEVNNKSI